jgi:hypothetical protein
MTPDRIIQHAHLVPGLGCKQQLHSPACQHVCAAIEAAAEETTHQHAAKAQKARDEAAGMVRQANAKGDQMVALQANSAAGMAEYLRQQILLPPGGCQTCLGKKQVMSTLAPGHMTRCPACAQQTEVA